MAVNEPDSRQMLSPPRAGLRCLADTDGGCLVGTPEEPPRFRVFDASDEQLLAYGFGPRPQDPVLYRIWHKMYCEQPTFLATRLRRFSNFVSNGFASGDGDADGDGQSHGVSARSRLGRSANWSGAAIVPHEGLRVVQIGARWIVPTVVPGVGSAPWACSTWIGIDGLRRWMKSMPQVGTTQSLGSTASPGLPNFAWVQWWLLRKGIQEPVVVEDFAIAPGQEVACIMSLIETTPGDPKTQEARCEIKNLDTNESTKPVIMVPVNPQGRVVPTGAASAQWILERPTALVDDGAVKKDDRYPLPKFASPPLDTFRFTEIAAEFAEKTGSARRKSRDLTAPRLIRMHKRGVLPDRSVIIASPRRLAARIRLDVAYTEKD